MVRAMRHRASPTHARNRAELQWSMPMTWLAGLLLLIVCSASASQQAPVGQDPNEVDPLVQDAASRPPVETRGVSVQGANEAAAAQPPTASQDPQREQKAQASTQQVSPASATPIMIDATHGVLFRVFPPMTASLPAELAAAKPAQPRSSYLLGTIHFGTPEEQGVDYAILEQALASTETFVNEANLDEPWEPSYDDYRWLPPAQSLSAMLSKSSYAMAHSLLRNVRVQELSRMKPWSVLALLEARGETGGDATMDASLQRIARASGKRLVHLETLEQQLQALDCVPANEHALVLEERLRAPWILRDESTAAMNYYRARNLGGWLADIDRMYGLSYAGKAIEQRSRHCLLEERNARWIGQLEVLFQDGPSFVAVGAVHLVGPEGLLAILRRDGYRIEEVPL